jgi:hypothetical protein
MATDPSILLIDRTLSIPLSPPSRFPSRFRLHYGCEGRASFVAVSLSSPSCSTLFYANVDEASSTAGISSSYYLMLSALPVSQAQISGSCYISHLLEEAHAMSLFK